MKPASTVLAAASRARRRCTAAARSLSPAAAIALILTVAFGGAGVADAATGGTFILGRANHETSKATLANSRGIPLALSAPARTAPLAVNRTALVKNLNAQFVGGLSAARLQATGGDGFDRPNSDTAIGSTVQQVASTGALPAGSYYATATALLDIAAGNGGGFCFISSSARPDAPLQFGGASQTGLIQAAETVAVSVAAGDSLQERCFIQGGSGSSDVDNAAITAIRVLSSTGTQPARSAQAASRGTLRSPAARASRAG
jgi:hypothetical protein